MLPPNAKPSPSTRGPEPLRRRRVQPVAASSPRWRRILNLVLGFATAVLLIDAFVGEKGLLEGRRARAAYQREESKLHTLRAENARLRETMRRYRDDPEAKEALARTEFGYVRSGEVLFIVRDVPAAKR